MFEVKGNGSLSSFLWRCSPESVAIVDIGDLDNHKIIKNFWDPNEFSIDKIDPLVLMMNPKPERIICLALVDEKIPILRTYQLDTKKFRNFELKQYQAELEIQSSDFQVSSMDKSSKTNCFFISVMIPDMPFRIIHTKITKEGLVAVSWTNIMVEDLKSITRITSFQIGKNDYLLINASNSLILARSKEKTVTIIHVFSNIFEGEVCDSCIFKNKIFCISPQSTFIVEISSNNKVDPKDMMEQFDEVTYEKYNVSKITVPQGHYEKLDMGKKLNSLFLIGKGIVSINDPHLAKYTCVKAPSESRFLS